MLTKSEIEQAFPWGPATEVATKRGPRMKLSCPVTPELERYYSRNRGELSALGVTFGEWPKGSGKFSFTWWQEIPEAVKQERERLKEASRAVDAEIELPAPPGLSYMGFQRAGIRYILENKMGVLLADEMGLGKTIQVIGYINAEPKCAKVLIVVPSGLLLNWRGELGKWLVRPMTIGIVDGKTFPTSDIVLIGYAMLDKWQRRLGETHFDLIACDECHYIKNPKAKRSRVIIGYKPRKDEPAELASAPLPARKRIFATGTPICNRPAELWPLVSTLNPLVFNNWWKFHQRYTGGNTGWGGSLDTSGASNLDELQNLLRQTCMVRRLKKEVLTELPPKVRQVVPLPADEDALREEAKALAPYREKLDALAVAAELAKAGDSEEAYQQAVANLGDGIKVAFQDVSRVRHATALAKLPAAIEHIQGMMDGGLDKLIVFAHHQDVIAGLMKALEPYGVLKIDGTVPPHLRQQAVNRFQNDPNVRAIVLSITAAGVGLTLTAASTEVFVEQDWQPGVLMQAEDRAHRIGQRNSVLVQHLVMEGSLDANMIRTIIEKMRIMDAALDRRNPKAAEEIGQELAIPTSGRTAPVSSARSELREQGAKLTEAQVDMIHQCLRMLAGYCDGAHAIDGMGFNKLDAKIGKNLAEQMFLSKAQAALGLKIITKYRRQLGADVITAIKQLGPQNEEAAVTE